MAQCQNVREQRRTQ